MKKPVRVCFDGRPLTVDIMDERKAVLAYNMLYSMAEDGVKFTVNGSSAKVSVDNLAVIDSSGEQIYPSLDPEWWASFDEPQEFYTSLAKQKENGDPQYSVTCKQEGNLLNFLPKTYDVSKAMDMYNFMQYGLDPSVSVAVQTWDRDWEDYYFETLRRENMHITDQDGKRLNEVRDPEWAIGVGEEQGFADAVTSIPSGAEQLGK